MPDAHGSGEFGAPRGTHTHHGVDYACEAGTQILSPVAGVVTKLGYPYGDDLSYRYVEIDTGNGLYHRVFYVWPLVGVGIMVVPDDVIGEAQDIAQRYSHNGQMNNHVHYEVVRYVDGKKEYLDLGDL